MNQESKQNAMRQRHHERDFQIFVELVLNGSHKPEGHIWSTPMVFQESSKRYEYSLKRTKKYIKITREKRALPQAAQWQEYNFTPSRIYKVVWTGNYYSFVTES